MGHTEGQRPGNDSHHSYAAQVHIGRKDLEEKSKVNLDIAEQIVLRTTE
jgi:hypothetical protein